MSVEKALKLYEMQLHDRIKINSTTDVLRVAGGWVYTNFWDSQLSCVFVPYNDEYLPIK